MTPTDKSQEKWEVQLRKGTLELAILAAMKHRTLYGLELLKQLQRYESTAITEGTLYPLLDRLNREGLVQAEWLQEGDGRPRKYYTLTPFGTEKLAGLTTLWRRSAKDIEALLTAAERLRAPNPGK
jgi:PadR family transcriptional regulator, regulatory protein PadR